MIIVIFGPPGSGKGTQSKLLSKELNIKHISSGEILRREKAFESDLNKGVLVSDEEIYELLKKEFTESFILDGFPRNVNQCKMLGDVSAAIFIDICVDQCKDRILTRNDNRADDNLDTMETRFKIYEKEMKGVYEFYDQKNVLFKVPGIGKVYEVFELIKTVIVHK